jgi:hypothetical protein
MDLWSFNGQTNQQWTYRLIQSGPYTNAGNMINVGSGKCLDVPGSSKQEGQQLDIYDCNGTGAQAFWFNLVGTQLTTHTSGCGPTEPKCD